MILFSAQKRHAVDDEVNKRKVYGTLILLIVLYAMCLMWCKRIDVMLDTIGAVDRERGWCVYF